MASLEQLRKKLKSVELTGQLTNAIKTVSSAKYAKLNKLFLDYKVYAEALEKLSKYCDFESLGEQINQKDVPDCYVIIGHNRGFCGPYNAELHAFANMILRENPNSIIISCGKKAINYLEMKGFQLQEKYIFPYVPDFDSCSKMIDTVYELYSSSKVKTVNIIYKKFINTLYQEAVTEQFLPFETHTQEKQDEEVLFLPDKKTVSADLQTKIIKSKLYNIILSAAIGAQASTLLAMRRAVDHANETAEKLNHEIHKKRQTAVTNGVIETSSNSTEKEE